MNLKNSIFYKNLQALYKLNLNSTTETHRAVIQALFNVFVMVKGDIDQAKLEMALNTATGEWLNIWGDYFNVPRLSGETDTDYSERIIQETIEPKVTLDAIKKSTARWLNRTYQEAYTSDDVSVLEPWKQLLKPSQRGTLSGESKLWSYDYWTYGIIDIALPDPTQFTIELIKYLDTIKAAGVKIVWSVRPIWDVIIGYWETDTLITNKISNKHGYSKMFYRSFMIWSHETFLGDDDSDYQSTLSGNPEFKLSGTRLLWGDIVTRYRDLREVLTRIRLYEGSSITRLSDIALILGQDYSTTTIGDMLDLELNEGLSNTEIIQYFTQATINPSTNGGILTHTLGSIQIYHVDLTNTLIGLANLTRNLEDSPLYKTLSSAKLDSTLGNFVYYDPEHGYNHWLSFEHLADILNMSTSELSLEYLNTHKTQVITALLTEASLLENVQAPTQITSLPV